MARSKFSYVTNGGEITGLEFARQTEQAINDIADYSEGLVQVAIGDVANQAAKKASAEAVKNVNASAVLTTAQSLSDNQKDIARKNIGVTLNRPVFDFSVTVQTGDVSGSIETNPQGAGMFAHAVSDPTPFYPSGILARCSTASDSPNGAYLRTGGSESDVRHYFWLKANGSLSIDSKPVPRILYANWVNFGTVTAGQLVSKSINFSRPALAEANVFGAIVNVEGSRWNFINHKVENVTTTSASVRIGNSTSNESTATRVYLVIFEAI